MTVNVLLSSKPPRGPQFEAILPDMSGENLTLRSIPVNSEGLRQTTDNHVVVYFVHMRKSTGMLAVVGEGEGGRRYIKVSLLS